ncbi:MAG: LamB/YcsF family protein, partial [Clostridia bacterium]|nr:LamB/YcsF family protein [Clostridia bacterium]
MRTIDLNSDLGESFGAYKMGRDEDVLAYISSANVACGFHAADPLTMVKTVRLAKARGVAVGAHPGYPDLVGFGRREMKIAPEEVRAMVIYQIGALAACCASEGIRLHHVKPHGAMYNMAAKDPRLADAICDAVAAVDEGLILYGLPGSEVERAAKAKGLRFAAELFADRAYEEDGSLVSRSKAGAMITDETEAISRMVRVLREGKLTSITGKDIALSGDTICVHGDGEKALAFTSLLRERLLAEGM